ncbi:hypothetical protein [Mycobacterium sp.]|uniref:hypothetical protein n=1 Tax=Mycobacterium sp. TaxID=1785 RepID=UPI002D9B43D9|nr:hypothetical protein [Mycobacterium sp.]
MSCRNCLYGIKAPLSAAHLVAARRPAQVRHGRPAAPLRPPATADGPGFRDGLTTA